MPVAATCQVASQGSEVLLNEQGGMLRDGASRAMATDDHPALLVVQQPCQLL